MAKELKQFSTINALMAGLYDGVFAVNTAKTCGNFGLGCSHALAGEVIIDQDFLEARGDQDVRIMANNECLPFIQITTFQPDKIIRAENVQKSNLYTLLQQHLSLDNIFVAVKITGKFHMLKIRRPFAQHKPYPAITDVFANQVVDSVSDIEGTLIGFWTPDCFKELSVAGFHLHFIDTTRKIGGHVIDFNSEQIELAYECKYSFNIVLPETEEYLHHDLQVKDLHKVIGLVEN